MIEKYLSFDGKEFATATECAAYEREHSEGLLIGMTADHLAAALSGEDRERAEALERAGSKVAAARRARGELKRVRKGEAQGVAGNGVAAGDGDPAPAQGEAV